MNFAPILLFTYKRLDTLKLTVEKLQQNNLALESDLFIFSDGPKNSQDALVINEIRSFLKTIKGFKKVNIIESDTNKGLATSIITGVDSVIKDYDSVIVLEDDLLTTKNFLNYMNSCLEAYKDSSNVLSISGYSFNLGPKGSNPDSEIYFLNRGWSWGWATWKNRWEKVDWKVSDYESFQNDRKERKRFALGGSDLNAMLDKQMQGKLDSWAIRWFYHQYKTQTLTVYPVASKVYNNGFDNNATHTTGSAKRYLPRLDTTEPIQFVLPDHPTLTDEFQKKFLNTMGLKARIVSKIQTIFKI